MGGGRQKTALLHVDPGDVGAERDDRRAALGRVGAPDHTAAVACRLLDAQVRIGRVRSRGGEPDSNCARIRIVFNLLDLPGV